MNRKKTYFYYTYIIIIQIIRGVTSVQLQGIGLSVCLHSSHLENWEGIQTLLHINAPVHHELIIKYKSQAKFDVILSQAVISRN